MDILLDLTTLYCFTSKEIIGVIYKDYRTNNKDYTVIFKDYSVFLRIIGTTAPILQ